MRVYYTYINLLILSTGLLLPRCSVVPYPKVNILAGI